jgi:hypothetical protein
MLFSLATNNELYSQIARSSNLLGTWTNVKHELQKKTVRKSIHTLNDKPTAEIVENIRKLETDAPPSAGALQRHECVGCSSCPWLSNKIPIHYGDGPYFGVLHVRKTLFRFHGISDATQKVPAGIALQNPH